LNRRKAIETVLFRKQDAIVFSSNGYTSRELFSVKDRKENFYVIGAMGFASSLALGYSLCAPEKETIILEGDANILMNLSSLVTIANTKPNLIHIILDNGTSSSTGGQKTYASYVDLSEMAEKSGYAKIIVVKTVEELGRALDLNKRPLFILAKISLEEYKKPRVGVHPEQLVERIKGLT